MATGQAVMTLNTEDTIWGLTYGPDGRYLVTCDDNATATVWDVSTGTFVITLTGHSAAENTAYSPGDGRYLAIAWGEGTAMVVDAETWATVHTLAGHTRAVYSIAYSPDGRSIASGSTDQTVRRYLARF
jgi:WD40 repeat protein